MMKFNSSFLVVLVAIAMCISYGQRVPTKVLYESEIAVADCNAKSVAAEYAQTLTFDTTVGDVALIVGKKDKVAIYADYDIDLTPAEISFPLVEPPGDGAIKCNAHAGADADVRCHNYINVIQKNTMITEWYYCGTSGIYPQCWKCMSRDCSADTLVGTSVPVEGLVTSIPGSDQPFLIAEVGGTDRFFGAAAKDSGIDDEYVIKVVDLADFAANPLDTEDANKNVLRHDGTDFIGKAIRYPDDGDYLYFFFRENAEEYTNIDKIMYSRVGRVCMNDAGGLEGESLDDYFTTFVKARLNCSVAGEYPASYDYLQDIYQSDNNEEIIYAVFTDTPIMDTANSAVCVYDMREIEAVFDNPDSDFKGQDGITSLWLSSDVPPLEPPDATVPRPGSCDTPQDIRYYPFIRDYPLMNQAVVSKKEYPGSERAFNVDDDSVGPLMLLDDIFITQLVVDEGSISDDVFFLGSVDGKVYKAYVSGSGNDMETRLVQEINLGSDSRVLAMELNDDVVYVGTTTNLHSIPVAGCCNVYTSENSCILGQNPYCSWTDGTGCGSSGDQCLQSDPTSCLGVGNFPAPSCYNHKTDQTDECTYPLPACDSCCADTSSCDLSVCNPLDCMPDHVRVTQSGITPEPTVQLSAFVRAPTDSVWGETTYACASAGSCGCPPVDVQETTARTTDMNNMEYLVGRYYFDFSACSGTVDVTLSFIANGQEITETITVAEDTGTLITDQVTLDTVKNTDVQIYAYQYQAAWWQCNKGSTRNAEFVYCYNCPAP